MTYKIVNRETGEFEVRQGVAYCFESDDNVALFGRKQEDGKRDSACFQRDQFEVSLVSAEGPVHTMTL